MEKQPIKINPPFLLREQYTQEVIKLLKSVTLGSNGAMYQHQNIDKRIEELYDPLFLNLERHEKVLGNITFCRRPKNWYVRYFAFDVGTQSSTKKTKSKANKETGLKRRIEDFFQAAFQANEELDSFYAYIDPKNERSLWMSQSFDFQTVAKIATQTFSRVYPKNQKDVSALKINDFIRTKIDEVYAQHPFYFTHHTFNDKPFYALKREDRIVAFAKIHHGEWKITRLPGKNGLFLKKIIPFIPGLRKIIRPNAHHFIVPDSVWVENNDPQLLEMLFQGILYQEKCNTILWWVDENETLYQHVKDKINWGLLHKINGVHQVDLVVRYRTQNEEIPLQKSSYITGIDFV